MKKRMVLLLLASLLLTGAYGQNRRVDLPKNIPLEEIQKKARKQKKLVLLDFGSPRCSPCLYIKNKIFTIDSIADFINGHFVSVDYTEGPEKKRLSEIYGVYSEPVLLICDAKGTLMHRMEGSCTPGEMMRRLRQGMDVKDNLVAQQAAYAGGNRDQDFLLKYIETLRVAGLNAEKEEILNLIFTPSFDVERLKETAYWDLFYLYNLSPVTKEARYVFNNLDTFYGLYGEAVVDRKIEQMYGIKVREFTYGKKPPIESQEYKEVVASLQNSEYPKASEWLIYLVPAQHKYKDWVSMAKAIENAIDFNVVKGKEKETYMIMMGRQLFMYSDDYEALTYALKWYTRVWEAQGRPENVGMERDMLIERMNALKP